MNYLDLTIRPMDNACNLHCKYCSIQSQYKGKSFFRQVSELPIWKWFPSLLKQMPLIEGLRAVTFGWHGGEPCYFFPGNYWKRLYNGNLSTSNMYIIIILSKQTEFY